MQQQSLARGIKEWSDHQSKWLPFLREKTARKRETLPETVQQDRAILFIEPRCHPATEFVLRNLRFFCSWPILIVHGTTNEAFMRNICEQIDGSFKFLSTRVADLPNPSYNTLFTCREFWNSFPERWILIAQTDTMLLKPADTFLQSLIDKEIAYIGAPWNYTCHACQSPLDSGCGHMIDQRVVASLAPHMVGNGGFCFRDKSKMLQVLEDFKLDAPLDGNILKIWNEAKRSLITQFGCTNEDVFYAKSLSEMPANLPTRQEALEFAIEQVPPLSWPVQSAAAVALGCHKPWVYLPPNLVRGILNRVEYE